MSTVLFPSPSTAGLGVAWKSTSTRRADGSSSGLRFRCPEPRIVGVQTFGKAAQMLHRIVGQLEMGVARHRADTSQARLDGVVESNDKRV